MESCIHFQPVRVVDYSNPHDLERDVELVQLRMLMAIRQYDKVTPRFKLVQMKALPSKKEIRRGLLAGGYEEYLRG